MERFELNIVINRPIEEIFAVLSSLENDLKWRTEWVDTRKTSEGPIGMGTRFSLFAKAFGKQIETVYETTQYEPSQIAAWKAMSGPLPLTFQRTLKRVEGGTRVTIRYEVELRGFFKLVMPLMIGSVTRQHEGDIHKLKELMETHAL
jgi:uncharacterized membrane protein